MKLKQLLEQLNQLAKERPEALEMEVEVRNSILSDYFEIKKITEDGYGILKKFVIED